MENTVSVDFRIQYFLWENSQHDPYFFVAILHPQPQNVILVYVSVGLFSLILLDICWIHLFWGFKNIFWKSFSSLCSLSFLLKFNFLTFIIYLSFESCVLGEPFSFIFWVIILQLYIFC